MATVTDERVSSTEVETKSIGMDGGSGHSNCMKCRFACHTFGPISTAYFVIGVSGLYVGNLRADANYIVPFSLVVRFYLIFLSLFLGWFQDAEVMRPCFEKVGCKRSKWGRRAPHATYALACLFILSFFTYRPSKWADMATEVKSTRTLNGLDISRIRVYSESNNYGESDVWEDFDFSKPYTDCSKKMDVTSSATNGTIYHFNETRTTANGIELPIFGNRICEALVAKNSVCWPGPTGSSKVGDGGPRRCAFIASEVMGIHFFFMAILGYYFCETCWQSGTAATYEVYPWKEERTQLKTFHGPIFSLGLLQYFIAFAFVTTQSELGARPNGAIGLRNTIAIFVAVVNLPSFMSIEMLKDARQSHEKDMKAKNPIPEYKDILTGPSTRPMRFIYLNTFFSNVGGSITNGTFWFLCYYVWAIPRESAGFILFAFAISGWIVQVVFSIIWGHLVFGVKSKKGREHSIDPRKYTLICEALRIVVNIGLWFTLLAPMPYEDMVNGKKSTGIPFILTAWIGGPFASMLPFWEAAAWGWGMDYDTQHHIAAGTRKRREAYLRSVSAGIRGVGNFIGIAIVNSLTLGAAPVCDTTLDTETQTRDCQSSLYAMAFAGSIVLMTCRWFVIFFYPLTGEPLKNLYLKQGEVHLAHKDTASWKTVVDPSTVNAAIVVSQKPVAQVMEVTLPEGATPGMELEYPLSNGTKVKVVVQEGQKAGDKVTISMNGNVA